MTLGRIKENKIELFSCLALLICTAIFRAASIFFIMCIIYIIALIICSHIRNKKITRGFLFLLIFLTSYPKMQEAIHVGPRFTWMYTLNYSFFKNMQFGKDVMFTYGPLGFLAFPQPVGNNLLIALCFNLFAYTLLVYSVISLIMPSCKGKRVIVMALYTILAWWILTRCNYSLAYISTLLVPLVILNYDLSARRSFMLIAAVAVSFLFLIKMGWGVVGALFLGSYLIIKLVFEKKYKLFFGIISLIITVFLAVWFLIYHNFSGLAGYLFSSFHFIRGNESAMSIDPGNDFSAIYFLSVLAVIIFLAFYLKEKKVNLINAIFFLPLIATFKYAFGGQDPLHTVTFLTILLVYFFVVVIQRLGTKKRVIFSLLFCIPLSLFFKNQRTPSFTDYVKQNTSFIKSTENFYNYSFGYKPYKEQRLHEMLELVKEKRLSPALLVEINQHPADIYPWGSASVAANNLNWRPRPVFDSYVAYTPYLDGVNYNFFTGIDAPEYIVWIKESPRGLIESVDGRYLLNDEPKTINKIIDNFEPVLYETNAVLLRNKEKPTFEPPIELYAKSYEWNKWIDVPLSRNSCIIAKIKFAPNFYGKVKRILWKEKEVFIEYKLKDGTVVKHRLITDNAISGVWIHPYITDIAAVLKERDGIYSGSPDNKDNLFFGETVVQVRFSYSDKDTFEAYFDILWEEYSLIGY